MLGLPIRAAFFLGLGTAALVACGVSSDSAEQRGVRVSGLSSSKADDLIADIRERFRVKGPDLPGVSSAPTQFLPASQVDHYAVDGTDLSPVMAVPPSPHGATTLIREDGTRVSVTDVSSGTNLTPMPRGLTATSAEISGGYVVFRDALGTGIHLVYRPTPEGAEDYVALYARPGVEQVSYDVAVSAGDGLRLVGNALELVDGGGVPRLHMAPPTMVDATARVILPMVSVAGCAVDTDPSPPWTRRPVAPGSARCQVNISWEAAGVSYPALLDPSWSTTASMMTGRFSHTLTTLSDGTVLAAGGYTSGSTPTSACEIFDPVKGIWTATGSLTDARAEHAALRAPDGTVKVLGGVDGAAYWLTVESFNPLTGTWGANGSLLSGRKGGTATLLINGHSSGSVLVVGGTTNAYSSSLAEAEIFNPATGGSTQLTVGLTTARAYHTATLLNNPNLSSSTFGEIVFCGGTQFRIVLGHYSPRALNDCEEFSPTSGTSGAMLGHIATMTVATAGRTGHTATQLNNGQVLLAAGADVESGSFVPKSTFDLLCPDSALGCGSTDSFATTTPPMSLARANHTAALVANDQVLVAGGLGTNGQPTQTSDLFNPGTSGGTLGWSLTGNLQQPRAFHAMVALPTGGTFASGGLLQATYTGDVTAERRDPGNDALTGPGISIPPSEPNQNYTETTAAATSRCVPTAGHLCGALARNLTVAYNSGNGPTFAGWTTFQSDRGWVQHIVGLTADSWGMPDNGTSDGSTWRSPKGDPKVIATGWPGQLLYVTMGDSVANPGKSVDVTMALSADAGITFGAASVGIMSNGQPFSGRFHVVTDQASGQGVDQPNVAGDPVTHIVYIMWRQSPDNVNGTSNDDVWFARYHFHADGTFDGGSPIEVNFGAPFDPDDFHEFELAMDCGNAVDNCVGGTERVFVTYNNTSGDNLRTSCAGDLHQLDLTIEYIETGDPNDPAPNWEHETIVEDSYWPECTQYNAGGRNRSHAPIVFDKVTQTRFVTFNSSLHNSDNSFQGSRVRLCGEPNGQSNNWSCTELSPICSSPPCPGNELTGSQFGSTLAIQPNQRRKDPGSVVAISWHDARAQPYANQAPPTTEFAAFFFPSDGNLTALGAISVPTDGPGGPNVPWLQTNPPGGGNTSWGDYEGMVADPFLNESAFYVPWADQRGQVLGNQAQVFGTTITVQTD